MSTRKSSRVPKPSAAAKANDMEGKSRNAPKSTGKRKQPPKSTGGKRKKKGSRTAPAEQIEDNGPTDSDTREERGPESIEQQMRNMLQEMLPAIIQYTREADEEDRQNRNPGNDRRIDDHDDQHSQIHENEQDQGNIGSLPKAGEMAWKKFGARIAVSVGVVAQAIVTGLAVAATAQLLSSSKVEDGALLLMAENSRNEVTHLAVYQLSIEGNVKRLAKVAASYVAGQLAEEQTRTDRVKVLNKFKGYWLSEESWEEVQLLKEEEFFWGVELKKKPWFPRIEAERVAEPTKQKPTLNERLATLSKKQDKGEVPQFEAPLYGNPNWYHIVSKDVITRSKKTQELIAKDGEKAIRANKHPERLELKGMSTYVLDIISIAPEYARDNPSSELCRQFVAKHQCPVCPAITVMVASEWAIKSKDGLRYFEDLNRIYGARRAKFRMQSYLKEGSTSMPLPAEFIRMFEEDAKLNVFELPIAAQAAHKYVTLIAMAYQMRLDFQQGLHKAVDRLFVYLEGHDLGIQSTAMQELITGAVYQLFSELEDYRIRISTCGKGDRASLLIQMEAIPDLDSDGPIHGLWEHLRFQDSSSAAKMLMGASNAGMTKELDSPGPRKPGKKARKDAKQIIEKAENDKAKAEAISRPEQPIAKVADAASTAKGNVCVYFNSTRNCNRKQCIRKHIVPPKESEDYKFICEKLKAYNLVASKEFEQAK